MAIGKTVSLLGGIAANVSFEEPTFGVDGAFVGGSVQIETPPTFGESPENVTLELNSSKAWQWPATIGAAEGFTGGAEIKSDNDSASATVSIPVGANVTGGSVDLSAPVSPLVGSYSLTLRTSQTSILALNGSAGYLSPTALSTVSSPVTITSLSTGQEPNGTVLVVLGTENGWLYTFDIVPGGALVFGNAINLGYGSPVTATLATTFIYSPSSVSVVAASGPLLFIFNQTAEGKWNEQAMRVTPVTDAPIITSLAVARYSTGLPAIVASTSVGTLEVTNFTYVGAAGGWNSPLEPLMSMGTTCSASLSIASFPSGNNSLAVGCLNEVETVELSKSNLTLMGRVSLPGGTEVDSASLDEAGSTLVLGTSSGELYSSNYPFSGQATAGPTLSSSPIVNVAISPSVTGEEIAAETQNGSIFILNGTSPNASQISFQAAGGSTVSGTLGFAGLLGIEEDLYFASGSQMEVARSVASFSSALVSTPWQDAISEALLSAPVSVDSYGNKVVDVPIVLSAQGGTATAQGALVTYNDSWTIPVPRDSFGGPFSLRTHAGSGPILTLELLAREGGQIHVELILEFVQTVPTPWLSSEWAGLQHAVATYGLYVVFGLVLSGGVLMVLGQLGYLKRPSRSSSAHPKKSSEEGPAVG